MSDADDLVAEPMNYEPMPSREHYERLREFAEWCAADDHDRSPRNTTDSEVWERAKAALLERDA